MIPLIIATFTASLLGSMHCVGMCGAFVAVAAAPTADRAAPAWMLMAAYHSGRLTTYCVLGILAGLLGQALNLGGEYVGVARAAAVLTGCVMVIFGSAAVARSFGVRVPRAPLPAFLMTLARQAHRAVFDWHPMARAMTIGLLTTLLPCGWLYAFVTTAAGTGSPEWGAITMAAFWVGTLPALMALGAAAQHLAGPLRGRLPLVTSLCVVFVGFLTIIGRLGTPAPCHDAPAAMTSAYCDGR